MTDIAAPSMQASAETLRLTLPKMSRFADSYSPISYALWYEYTRGENPALRLRLDELTHKGERLDAKSTQALYDEFVRAKADEAVARAKSGLITLLRNMQTMVHDLGTDNAGFDQHLRSFDGALHSADSLESIQSEVSSMAQAIVQIRDSSSRISEELVNNQHEVSRLSEELQQLRNDAVIDPLSGLMNRRAFDRAIAAMQATLDEGGPAYSVVMFDIDFFKRVNDTHGHLTGDRVIQGIANIIKGCVKGADIPCRFGGEEFSVLFPATTRTGAGAVAEQVRYAIEQAQIRKLDGSDFVRGLTISAGVAQAVPKSNGEDVLSRADAALYRAKQTGRNRVVLSN